MSDKYSVGILTISDRSYRGEREDLGGPILIELIEKLGFEVKNFKIVPDERIDIRETIEEWVDEDDLALILTTGGTGFSDRDITPEITIELCDRRVPGISEAMRSYGAKFTPMSYLSRAESGIRKNTLIINFPGNPKAIRENFEAIIPFLKHGIDTLRGKNNLKNVH